MYKGYKIAQVNLGAGAMWQAYDFDGKTVFAIGFRSKAALKRGIDRKVQAKIDEQNAARLEAISKLGV